MSKSKNRPQWVKDYYRPRPNRATTGTKDCQDCHSPAYSHHRPTCPKVR